METAETSIAISKTDYEMIMHNIRSGLGKLYFHRRDAEALEAELRKAVVAEADDMPADVVRLNALVTIRGENDEKAMQLRLVAPEKTDISQRQVSVLSPIGAALIGRGKGQTVGWKVPAGFRKFMIVDVMNG
ncbi:MAG: GreA/GreB family elongation factor [Flavisolibacter sp.]